jgi:GTP-binding protein EngB required for normal cell division
VPSFANGSIDVGLQSKLEFSLGKSKSETKDLKEDFDLACLKRKRMIATLIIKEEKVTVPCTLNVTRKIDGREYKFQIPGSYYCNAYSSESNMKQIDVKNILIVGWTGSGKSTLANVLSESNDFEESDKSTPETKWGKKSKEFEHKGNHYCVVDNIGFGDTEVGEREELIRIGEEISKVSQGLSHVLFVFKKRFSVKEKEAFGKLNALKITNHLITVVRSNFDNFESKKKCKEDEELLKNESSEIREVLNSCRGILHVNNDEDEDRNTSREIVLNHLHDSCKGNPLPPEEWKKIEDIKNLIENYFAKRKELESKKGQADDIQKGEIKQQIDNLESSTAEQVGEKIQENEVYRLAQIIQEAK